VGARRHEACFFDIYHHAYRSEGKVTAGSGRRVGARRFIAARPAGALHAALVLLVGAARQGPASAREITDMAGRRVVLPDRIAVDAEARGRSRAGGAAGITVGRRTLLLCLLGRALDALRTGDDEARSLGKPCRASRRMSARARL